MTYQRSTVWLLVLACLLILPGSALGQAQNAPRIHERPSTQPTITLQAVTVPAVGTEAAYYLTNTEWSGVLRQTGAFASTPVDEFESETTVSIRARYTVLAPDRQTGHARVLVQAQPVDPTSRTPLTPERWEAIYLVTPNGADWQSGSTIPALYSVIVSPRWLTDWTLTPFADLPKGALRPGTTWRATRSIPELQLVLGDTRLPISGSFVRWDALPGTPGPTAYIWEGVDASGTSTIDLDGIPAISKHNISGGSEYWLLPNEFPWGAHYLMTGTMQIVIGPETGAAPGMSGTLDYQFSSEQSVEWDPDVNVVWLEGAGGSVLWPDIASSGALGSWSTKLSDGTLADFFTFSGQANDVVSLRMNSTAFDAYVFLMDDSQVTLAMDNDSGGGTNALIRYILPYTGSYIVMANAMGAGDVGAYTLLLTVDGSFYWDRALALIAGLQDPLRLSDEEFAEAQLALDLLWRHADHHQYVR